MIPLTKLPSPCYLLEESKLLKNLEILKEIKDKTGCKVLLALKAFSMYSIFPTIRKYLDGVSASSVNEACLGFEEFKKEVHVCAPAYSNNDFKQIINYANHIVFNSFSQWYKFKNIIESSNKKIEISIRINPEYSEVKQAIYNPCSPFSRLGVTIEEFEKENLLGISGLHFHCLCQHNSNSLANTLNAIEIKFGNYLKHMKWLNLGGGHHITCDDYDRKKLCQLINHYKEKYNLEIILEPGEAVALNTGVLVSSVLDIVKNKIETAILDSSATAHMPDVLEMPYRPEIIGAGLPNKLPYTYILAGNTCLAGDIIGDYSFKKPLKIGTKLVFKDMAIYTMVKNNTFNGINLPSIALLTKDNNLKITREFGYQDFKSRL